MYIDGRSTHKWMTLWKRFIVLLNQSRASKYWKKLLKVLLLDLYVAWCADPLMKIILSRDNNAYKARSRYNELHIGKTISSIVDTLITEGIIYEQKGFYDRITGLGFQSRR